MITKGGISLILNICADTEYEIFFCMTKYNSVIGFSKMTFNEADTVSKGFTAHQFDDVIALCVLGCRVYDGGRRGQ